MQQVNITVLNVGYAQTRYRWGGQDVTSPFARLYYVKRGRARLTMGGQVWQVCPGNMYLVPAFARHRYECDPGIGFYYMFLYEHVAAEGDAMGQLDFPVEVRANQAADLLFTNFMTMYPQLSVPYARADDFERHPACRDYAARYAAMHTYEKMQLRGLAMILLSYFVKRARPRPEVLDERLARVVDYVTRNLADDISVDDMASVACVAKTHLTRLFRRKMSLTPLHYLISRRVQCAQGLLLTSDLPVAQVGEAVGVRDASYFIRLFKKYVGLTPQAYRNTLR